MSQTVLASAASSTTKRYSKTATTRILGFTLIEIMIVVSIIGILLAIATPNLQRARESSRQKACISNLKMINDAKEMWALENNKSDGASVQLTWLIGTYIAGPKFASSTAASRALEFRCPSSNNYYGPTMGAIGESPICPTPSARSGDFAHVR